MTFIAKFRCLPILVLRLAIIAPAFAALLPLPAPAANLYSYDLDSLIYMSGHVVRGRIGPRQDAGSVTAHRFTVTAAFSGQFKPGDTLHIAALDFFCKEDVGTAVHVGEGDEVIAFLCRARSGFAFEIPDDSIVYMPVPAGLRLILDGRACDFSQENTFGGYILQRPGGRHPCPHLATFEKDLAAAIAVTRPVAAALIGPAALTDAPRLLQFLRSRAHLEINVWKDRDAISEAVCAKLAELRDLPSLDAALLLLKPGHGIRTLFKGYATREGCAHLLTRLSDINVTGPVPLTDTLARALADAARGFDGTLHPGDSGFLQRLARTALSLTKNPANENAAAALFPVIKGAVPPFPLTLEADLAAALRLISQAAPAITSPLIRFRIDEALQESDPGLSFAAAVPPIVVMVRQLLPGSGYATKPGHLTVEIRSEPSAEAQRRKFEIELVLEDPATRRTWSLTPAKFLHASGSMSRMLPLPADLHKAPCHLRPRILEAGRFIANGHGPILDLP